MSFKKNKSKSYVKLITVNNCYYFLGFEALKIKNLCFLFFKRKKNITEENIIKMTENETFLQLTFPFLLAILQKFYQLTKLAKESQAKPRNIMEMEKQCVIYFS